MKSLLISFIQVVFATFFFFGCKDDGSDYIPVGEGIPLISYGYITSYPHDTATYTEGFLFSKDSLFESTGSMPPMSATSSVFGPVDLETGKIRIRVALDKKKYFGEGITYLNGKFYQLTYTNRVGFVYDAATYGLLREFPLPGAEGWGLTTDGEWLIMSDGTDKLTYLDPQTFLVKKIIHVTQKGSPKTGLNELEFIKGDIYACYWLGKTIVRIDTSSGKVTGIIDLASFAKEAENIFPGSLEMNGIAYDPGNEHIFITGKFWPKIYEIKISGSR